MYYQGDDRVFDRNELDVRLLKYNYSITGPAYDAAEYKHDKTKKKFRLSSIRDTVPVYPDTLWFG